MTNNFKELEATFTARKEGPTPDEYKSMPQGFWAAYFEWRRTQKWNVDETTLVLDYESLQTNERKDFINALRDNGITTLAITYIGTWLMDILADFIKNGVEMTGMTKIQVKNPGPVFDEPKNAIKMTIKPKDGINWILTHLLQAIDAETAADILDEYKQTRAIIHLQEFLKDEYDIDADYNTVEEYAIAVAQKLFNDINNETDNN